MTLRENPITGNAELLIPGSTELDQKWAIVTVMLPSAGGTQVSLADAQSSLLTSLNDTLLAVRASGEASQPHLESLDTLIGHPTEGVRAKILELLTQLQAINGHQSNLETSASQRDNLLTSIDGKLDHVGSGGTSAIETTLDNVLTQIQAIQTALAGTLDINTKAKASAAPSLFAVNVSATSVELLDRNTARNLVVLHNNTARKAYVTFGPTSSLTLFTLPIDGFRTLTLTDREAHEELSVIWDGVDANGKLMVTERTA